MKMTNWVLELFYLKVLISLVMNLFRGSIEFLHVRLSYWFNSKLSRSEIYAQDIHIWCGFHVLRKLELAYQTENVNRICNRDLIIPRSLINHLHSELDTHQFSTIPLAIQ